MPIDKSVREIRGVNRVGKEPLPQITILGVGQNRMYSGCRSAGHQEVETRLRRIGDKIKLGDDRARRARFGRRLIDRYSCDRLLRKKPKFKMVFVRVRGRRKKSLSKDIAAKLARLRLHEVRHGVNRLTIPLIAFQTSVKIRRAVFVNLDDIADITDARGIQIIPLLIQVRDLRAVYIERENRFRREKVTAVDISHILVCAVAKDIKI